MGTAVVTETFLLADGTPDHGAVTFRPYVESPNSAPERIVTDQPVSVRLDETGSISVELVASDDPGWELTAETMASGGMPYVINILLASIRTTYTAFLPTGTHILHNLVDLAGEPDVVIVPGGGGGEGGAVASVNGKTGFVVLDAADVGADPAGTAASAVSAHEAASDPHPQYLTPTEHAAIDHSTIPGGQGPEGPPGPPGGAILSGWWTYSTATTGPAPTGQVRTGPTLANLNDTGTLWIDAVDADGLDWSAITVIVTDRFWLRSKTGEQWVLEVTAVNGTGDYAVELVSATAAAPRKNERVQVSLVHAAAAGGGLDQATADARYVNVTGDAMNGPLDVVAAVNGAGLVDIYQQAASGLGGAALNVTSNNPDESAVWVRGHETARGTVKITHDSDGADSGAAAISIDLVGTGTQARGLYMTSTEAGTTGDWIACRFNGVDAFVVKPDGRVAINLPIATTPGGRLELSPGAGAVPGLVIKADPSGGDLAQFKRSSDGAVRTRVDSNAQLVTQQIAYFTGTGIQIGSTSTDFGGGSGAIIGLDNAGTPPSTNPTNGVILYAEGGVLKVRQADGQVIALDVDQATGDPHPQYLLETDAAATYLTQSAHATLDHTGIPGVGGGGGGGGATFFGPSTASPDPSLYSDWVVTS